VVGGLVAVAGAFVALLLLARTPPGWLVLGVGVALLVGLVDDLRPLPAWLRVVLLALAGVVLAPALSPLAWPFAAAAMAALVVATANAVNILDGQDALAGGLVSVAALALATTLSTNRPASWLGLAVAGATLGFLVWNRPPARMFLGNGGAYALGTLLAVVTASLLAARGWEGAVVAGACLSVFSFEVASTMLRRWRLGRSLTGGDRSHSYDVLARRLGSRTASTLVFVGIGLLGWGAGALLALAPSPIGLAALAVVFVLAVLASVRLWSPAGRA
jgi:UDP-N-acetylmuramyl pentapeptide phosphotransferase/UDP-N-acetylglucosamine-1-phosphate transferase